MSEHTPLHAFRLSDETWQAVRDKARTEERTVSAVIRELLERWLADK